MFLIKTHTFHLGITLHELITTNNAQPLRRHEIVAIHVFLHVFDVRLADSGVAPFTSAIGQCSRLHAELIAFIINTNVGIVANYLALDNLIHGIVPSPSHRLRCDDVAGWIGKDRLLNPTLDFLF